MMEFSSSEHTYTIHPDLLKDPGPRQRHRVASSSETTVEERKEETATNGWRKGGEGDPLNLFTYDFSRVCNLLPPGNGICGILTAEWGGKDEVGKIGLVPASWNIDSGWCWRGWPGSEVGICDKELNGGSELICGPSGFGRDITGRFDCLDL